MKSQKYHLPPPPLLFNVHPRSNHCVKVAVWAGCGEMRFQYFLRKATVYN